MLAGAARNGRWGLPVAAAAAWPRPREMVAGRWGLRRRSCTWPCLRASTPPRPAAPARICAAAAWLNHCRSPPGLHRCGLVVPARVRRCSRPRGTSRRGSSPPGGHPLARERREGRRKERERGEKTEEISEKGEGKREDKSCC